jgi:hypothetical protein
LQIANAAYLYPFLLPHYELKVVVERACRRIRVCLRIYPRLTIRIWLNGLIFLWTATNIYQYTPVLVEIGQQ